jgi:hypothetical protein
MRRKEGRLAALQQREEELEWAVENRPERSIHFSINQRKKQSPDRSRVAKRTDSHPVQVRVNMDMGKRSESRTKK